MTEFDTAALADRIISERNMTPQTITRPGGRLEFSPSMVGDGAYISDVVRNLTPADRESIARQGMRFNSAGLQIGFRALHINTQHSLPESLMRQTVAAVLALEIATRLHVTIQ
jgi:hypothetical protein